MCVRDRVCARVFLPMCTSALGRVSVHGYCSLERVCMSTILDRNVRGVPQHVCAAVCSQRSAPAGCAIPIYPSATEAGGESAGHRCRRFHMRGTRLPVRGPLCGGDEGGRRQGHCVGESGLFWDGRGGGSVEQGGEGSTTQRHSQIHGFSVFWGA